MERPGDAISLTGEPQRAWQLARLSASPYPAWHEDDWQGRLLSVSSRNGQLWGRTQTTEPEVRGKLEAVQRTLLCLHRTPQAEAARRPAHAPPSASQVPPRPAPALHLGPLLRVPPVRLALQPPKPRCRPRRPPPRDSRALRRPPSPEVASVRDRRQNSSAERWDRAKKKVPAAAGRGCGRRELGRDGVRELYCAFRWPALGEQG